MVVVLASLTGCTAPPVVSSDFFPAYTADGTRLLFVSIPFEDGNAEVWMMSADGEDRRKLTSLQRENSTALADGGFHPATGKGLSFFPAVAPDGRRAAFASILRTPATLHAVLFTLDLASTALEPRVRLPWQRLGPVAWSRDGRSLAYVADVSGTYELWTLSLTSGRTTQLTRSELHMWSPSWAPSDSIVFAARPRSVGDPVLGLRERGRWGLFVCDASTGSFEPLLQDRDDTFSPAWDPTGTRVAFVSRRRDAWELNVLDVASRRVSTLHRDPNYVDHPAWHPSGSRIAFTRGAAREFQGYFMDLQIWELTVADGKVKRLSAHDGPRGVNGGNRPATSRP